MQESLFSQVTDHIYTVSELNHRAKALLEQNLDDISLLGEISNFHAHSSGHFYFKLKDVGAQISAVMFRGANRHLKFQVENGLEVIVHGRASLYEPRGEYQFYVETMEPKGLGALQLAFEQLRERLEKEGLFAPEAKQELPYLPKTVGIITSPTGAAIRDLIHVLRRRSPQTNILLYPVQVQGEAAAPQIAQAIAAMNRHGEADLLIVGRGGGSLEDLWAFNMEEVARAIAASQIPIISAVGHETDFTISDYVADLRAPTPSAAAELAVPQTQDLKNHLNNESRKLLRNFRLIIEAKRSELKYHLSHLETKHPKRQLQELAQCLDDLVTRLRSGIDARLQDHRTHLAHLSDKLQVLSPLSILSRGYSITQKAGGPQAGQVVKSITQVKPGDPLDIRVTDGRFKAEVK